MIRVISRALEIEQLVVNMQMEQMTKSNMKSNREYSVNQSTSAQS